MDGLYGDLENSAAKAQQAGAAAADLAVPQPTFDDADDAELAALQQQVNDIQQEHAVNQLRDAASREEGARKKAAPAAPVESANTSVFVGGMDPRTSEQDLRLFFHGCGAVARITILRDKVTGQPKGTAYVTFEADEGATAALLKDGQPCHGKPLKIAVKRDNVPASMRGGRGGAPPRGGPRGGGAGFGGGPANPMMAMMGAMMAAMGQQGGFTPYNAPRGRGRGGRGRGAQ